MVAEFMTWAAGKGHIGLLIIIADFAVAFIIVRRMARKKAD